jgi:Leucine-rich repeat (LRR) protein
MSANLFTMVSLRVLILFRNELSGGLPEGLGDLPCLEHIDLSHNTFTGAVPESLGRLINLRQLHLEFNQFAGELHSLR